MGGSVPPHAQFSATASFLSLPYVRRPERWGMALATLFPVAKTLVDADRCGSLRARRYSFATPRQLGVR